jgi:amino acid adenylation domain-containing protein
LGLLSTELSQSSQLETLDGYLRRQAERAADAPGIADGADRFTYGQLEESANRLARLLQESGCERGDRICLLVSKSAGAIVAMQAALKAGCAYVPIDIASPAARVERILAAAEPRLILTAQPAAGLVDDLLARRALAAETVIGSVDADPVVGEHFRSTFATVEAEGFSPDPLPATNDPDDAAHILFTSGSTGIPKGVVITHRNVVRFVEWAVDYFGIEQSDRVSGHPPLHFDLSTFDIYGAFAAGAELHVVPGSLNLLPHKLAAFIEDRELTQWFSVPSVLAYLTKFDVVRQDAFPQLKRLLWCGEVMPTPALMYLMNRLPHVRFTNLYGPTEATIASSYYTVPAAPSSGTDPIPIGTPCAGEELFVLDEQLDEVPVGEIGDLYIGGVGLSPGYWRDEEKTSAAFVEGPRSSPQPRRIYRTGDLAQVGEDGLVYFHGRADSQIKSRGYRIELGEIEVALNALEALREAAVVAVEADAFGGTTICCAYAPMAGRVVAHDEVAGPLREVLPSYMIPTRWKAFDALPKNVNGKIDRAGLKAMFAEDAASPDPAAAER